MAVITFQNMKELPYALEEAVNRLAVNINFTEKSIRSIMITSSFPSEGKSFVAVHLWRKLADSGLRTVLVDSDLRHSVLQERYSFTSDAKKICGISYYLSGQIPLEEAIYQTNIPNGDIVPLSETVVNPSPLLQGDTYRQMLQTLSGKYDYVIVDTAPLELVADGEQIASLCDGAVLVVRAGETPRNVVSGSMKLIGRAGCQLLGIVLNRVATGAGTKYGKYQKYGYGYDYGYGYGPKKDGDEHRDGSKHSGRTDQSDR